MVEAIDEDSEEGEPAVQVGLLSDLEKSDLTGLVVNGERSWVQVRFPAIQSVSAFVDCVVRSTWRPETECG